VTTVGIIANPASGKDIRRLIAHGSVFDNQEKVSIVRRVMLGLESAGVTRVVFMPDYFGIGEKAAQGIQTRLQVATLEMRIQANQDDSTQAARMMREQGVGAMITLGGDGTNRAVAKESGDVPILAISTGTNNVFPQMIEGTVAGLAAGIVAGGRLPLEETTTVQRRLEIYKDGVMIDLALVDVVVSIEAFIASRAIWDMSSVRELVLTRASPSNIGLSSIGGGLYCRQFNQHHGVYLRLSEEKGLVELTAPIAPGLVETMHIAEYQVLNIGDEIPVHHAPSILALDGEREVTVRAEEQVTIKLTESGPRLIDLHRTMQRAAQEGLMIRVENKPQAAPGACMLRAIGLCTNPLEVCLEEMK
jgi:predicted polyphosphate/ATP-dependent NAD kinase